MFAYLTRAKSVKDKNLQLTLEQEDAQQLTESAATKVKELEAALEEQRLAFENLSLERDSPKKLDVSLDDLVADSLAGVQSALEGERKSLGVPGEPSDTLGAHLHVFGLILDPKESLWRHTRQPKDLPRRAHDLPK